ncbi:MAG: hypothetical protein JNG83_07750 [Opitutaceae bacterium]|nr:hypothetical protein [Opitutaceae bacterium]
MPPLKLAQPAAATQPVGALQGPHLLIDDYLIAHAEGLARKTHSPVRDLPGPVLAAPTRVHQPFVTVVRDPHTRRFRMWYNYIIAQPDVDFDGRPDTGLAYAESDDGVHWQTPALNILGPDNRVLRQLRGKYGTFGASVLDEGPDFPKPAERFKTAWWSGEDRPFPGVHVAHSADGIHWVSYTNETVLRYYEPNDERWGFGVQDIVEVFRDPLRGHYSLLHKLPAAPEDNYAVHGATAGALLRRLIGQSTSRDFVHWSQPWRIGVPQAFDDGAVEFYAIGGTFARGQLLVGFARVLRDDQSAEAGGPVAGIGWTSLVTSRDGVSWQRHPEVFFDRNPVPGSWDRAMSWIGSAVPVGDELYLYYGGYKRGHKIEPTTERQIGLVRMPRDRFVGRAAFGPAPGRLQTVAFQLPRGGAARLSLNMQSAPGGTLRVQFRNAAGGVVAGYGFADFSPLTGDGQALRLRRADGTEADLRAFSNETFSLEFELNNAELFAFSLEN